VVVAILGVVQPDVGELFPAPAGWCQGRRPSWGL
jgi:hypothetical protein